ncbi:uncharacterized protein LOC126278858 [Schistocerca gregaria]|uniref:uncharacterized protein LOC126278858 n=1 Tax=Schistocerca gregaria TaxID=7010 RepID=UPI00211EDC4B|nr:uncharacterized protein LOC126278858 [Schistocerca gregaria]
MPESVCSSSEKKRRVEESIDSSNIRKRLFSEIPTHRGVDGGNQKIRPSNSSSEQVSQSENKFASSACSYWMSVVEEIRKERESLSAKAQACRNMLMEDAALNRQMLEKLRVKGPENVSEEMNGDEDVDDRIPNIEFSSDNLN